MPRRAIPVAQTKTGMTNETKAARAETDAEWRRGVLSEYEPLALDQVGIDVFNVIADAIPPDRMTKVDGYTVEAAADAIAKMVECREIIANEGLITEDGQQNKAVLVYTKYSEIAKRYLVELGCTPSARAKIASDAAMTASKKRTVADIFADDD